MIQCICFVCNCNWIFFHCWQEKFCNKACVERFLKAKNDTVKKAAKQLRNCLSWRDSIGTGLCLLLLVFTVSSQNLAFLYFQILALLIKVLKNLVTIKVDHPKRTKDFDFFFTVYLCLISDHLIADEFSAELADGLAYVAGHDGESRPVMVVNLIFFPLFFSRFCF